MKDYLAHEKIADTIREITKEVKDGRQSRSYLLQNGRLSLAKLKKKLDYQGQLCLSSIIVSPLLHSAYRKLKFAVEKIPEDELNLGVIEANYKSEIEEIREFLGKNEKVKSKFQLAKANIRLYQKISSIPHRATIYRLAGINEGRPDYFYWTDGEIIKAASQFQSFAELKYSACALHRHVKGRGLEKEIVRANPAIANHFYIGLDYELYRSEPELVFGNLLKLNGISHEREVSMAGKVIDFFFKEKNLYVEILQNDTEDRGSRRAAYKARSDNKRQVFGKLNLNVVFFDTDPFFYRGVFFAVKFLQGIRSELLRHAFDIGHIPASQKILFRDDKIKMYCLNASSEEILPYLLKLGVDGVATLQNRFSHLLTMLQYRHDFDQIIFDLKIISTARRSDRQRARHFARREKYVPLSHVKELARKNIISSQKQWSEFAKKNKSMFIAEKIPSNVVEVYRQRGEWEGWGKFLSK